MPESSLRRRAAGIGAGISGALFPVLVADLTRGTGRFNVSQGAAATVQGFGAAVSSTFAGFIIVSSGYSTAFLVLTAVAGLGFVLFLLLMPETKIRQTWEQARVTA